MLVFFGSGLLFRSGEVVVRGSGPERTFVSAPIWSRALGCLLVAVVTGIYLLVTLRGDMARYQRVLWLFNLLVGLFLAAAGYHLSPLLSVVRLWVRRMWNLAAVAAESLYVLALRLVGGVFTVLEYASFLLATPIFALRRQPIPAGASAGPVVGSAVGPLTRGPG